MIEIHPLRDKEKLSKLYAENGVSFGDDSIAITAADGDEILGYCLFDLTAECGVVHSVYPIEDIPFADGLLRSALHVCVENGKSTAYYSEGAPMELFEKLGFIKNTEKRELDVDKLFSSCKNCQNT